jgi:hypothetical protein
MSNLMRLLRADLAASAGATLVQPCLEAVWILLQPGGISQIPWQQALLVSAIVLIIAAVFVLVLGLPAFVLLQRSGRNSVAAVGATGAALAAVPLAILSWPLWVSGGNFSSGGNWYGRQVDFFIDGQPTLYGWLSYGEGVLQFGIHGLVGALVFRSIWRRVVVDERPA